ncbi:MAG: glycosyltransferase family 9 protein [Chitinivibrionales bacterium]
MKIIVLFPIGIGNYILCRPAAALLKKEFPNARLSLLALRKSIPEIAKLDNVWERVFTLEPGRSNLFNTLNVLWKIRREKFDYSLSMFPSNKWQYNLLPFISGIPCRYGFRYRVKRLSTLSFLNTKRIDIDPKLHDTYQNLNILKLLYIDRKFTEGDIDLPDLFSERELRSAREYTGDRNFFAVHPGSSNDHGMAAKRWDTEKFIMLSKKIIQEKGWNVLVLGGKEESEIKKRVKQGIGDKCVVPPEKSLPETAALLSTCKMCLCNDSGLMHLSAATETPVAAVFGPTDEKRNGPLGKGHLIIRKQMPGFPVWNAANAGDRSLPRGTDPKAPLLSLTWEEAWKKVKPWIDKLE